MSVSPSFDGRCQCFWAFIMSLLLIYQGYERIRQLPRDRPGFIDTSQKVKIIMKTKILDDLRGIDTQNRVYPVGVVGSARNLDKSIEGIA